MRKSILLTLLFFVSMCSLCMAQRRLSGYFQAQYNKTLYDRTPGNNPWGPGIGFQVLLNSHSKLKPLAEITADVYLEDDKVLRLNENGSATQDLGSMFNFFVGTSYQLSDALIVSIVTGPALVGGNVRLGIKPTLGLFFSENRKWTGRVSYLNIFNRDKITKDDFGAISIALAVKVF